MAKKIQDLDTPSLPLNPTDLFEVSQGGIVSVKVALEELLSSLWTYSSIVNTTSGTIISLTTSIPSTALEIEIMLNGVSTNTAAQPPIIRLGDAGGIRFRVFK